MSFPDFDQMRVRELKKFLIDNFGVPASSIAKILDKKELKDIANAHIQGINDIKYQQQRWIIGKAMVTVVLGMLVLWQTRSYWSGYVNEQLYGYKQQFGMLKVAARNRLYLATIAMFFAILFDAYYNAIQLQIMLGWASIVGLNLVPYRLPTLSLPMSPSQVMGRQASKGGALASVINGGLDIGPMISLWIISFCRRHLQEYAAGALLFIAQDKEVRREAKRMAKQQRNQDQQQQENIDVLSSQEGMFS